MLGGERLKLVRGGRVIAAIVPAPEGGPARALPELLRGRPTPRASRGGEHGSRHQQRTRQASPPAIAVGLLIDASVLIEFERGSLELEPLVASRGDVGVTRS